MIIANSKFLNAIANYTFLLIFFDSLHYICIHACTEHENHKDNNKERHRLRRCCVNTDEQLPGNQ